MTTRAYPPNETRKKQVFSPTVCGVTCPSLFAKEALRDNFYMAALARP